MPKHWQREIEELRRQLDEEHRKLRELMERTCKRLRESDDRLKSVNRTLTRRRGADSDDGVTH